MLVALSVAGDVIVAGSDGLFDNMFDDEICEGVGGLNGAVDAAIVQLTCNAIAAQAQQKSAAQQVGHFGSLSD